MNWAPPVLSSSRLYQPLWSGPGVDDITGFYCIEKKNTLHPSQSNRTVFLLCFECYPSTFTRFPSRPFDLSSPFLSVEFDDEEFPCQKVTGPPRQGRWWEEEGVGGGGLLRAPLNRPTVPRSLSPAFANYGSLFERANRTREPDRCGPSLTRSCCSLLGFFPSCEGLEKGEWNGLWMND